MHGTPLASHWSATGFVVSGVDETSMTSTASCRISSRATSPARLASDWLSLSRMVSGLVAPPADTPPLAVTHLLTASTTNASASPKPASAPVLGDT